MAEGRSRQDWEHTSFLVCAVANLLGSKLKPETINPFLIADRKERGDDPNVITDPKEGFAMLKGMMGKSNG